ncbi:hypothetical protein [Mesorhizobium sp. RMAD-H1]|uniref:AbiU2 domain-containing protein n=1 Tax=Mesorhizobium sp. RMAD-H1 TaxID=2587065 RepID=UPI0016072EDF|nr:hypothetical protein [Mesorhizobium sp. RMAD-H1]MBB2969814.1 hypothetical protein [Mesorhizobium sp. RMAD-H1]
MAKKAKRKKPNVIGTKAAVAKLDRMMPILEKNIVGALMIEVTLEAGNDIVLAMPDKDIPGADAYNQIRHSLSFDLAMHLARLFDKGSGRYHANNKDTASIPLMIRLLRQKRCRQALAQRARNWNPALNDTFAAMFERDCLSAIDRASEGYTATFRGKFGRSGLRRLKIARDNHFAHSLMSDRELNLIYHQLFRLTDCARDILDAANIAIAGTSLELTDKEEIFRERAEDFWKQALLGKSEDETAD